MCPLDKGKDMSQSSSIHLFLSTFFPPPLFVWQEMDKWAFWRSKATEWNDAVKQHMKQLSSNYTMPMRYIMFMWFFFFALCLGHWWVYLPSKGQKLWHTGAFWEKRTERCSHSCSHGCNKGNADSGHLFCTALGVRCSGIVNNVSSLLFLRPITFMKLWTFVFEAEDAADYCNVCVFHDAMSSPACLTLLLILKHSLSRFRVKEFCQTDSGVSACRISLPTSLTLLTAAPTLRSLQPHSTEPDLWCAASLRATRVRRCDFHTASCHLQ